MTRTEQLTKRQLLHIWDLLIEIDSGDNISQTLQNFISDSKHTFGITEKSPDWDNRAWSYKGIEYDRGDERCIVENNNELFEAWSEILIEEAIDCYYGDIKEYLESIPNFSVVAHI